MRKPNSSFGVGRLKAGVMNKAEALYSQYLEELKQKGEVLWYKFEGIKFKLADNTTYTPDFAVMLKSNEIQLHEIKGFWTSAARIKIKVAADMYPFQFIAFKVNPKQPCGNWVQEEF